MSNMAYRDELDGVRALTMITILLFHLGFPSVPGGFIVVEVFFVLSGYLILGQTYMRLQDGNFSVTDFFARRIRRLAPAYGVCFLIIALVANWFYLRSEMQMVAENFLGAITFTNNFNLMGSAGYFAGPNAENPFLHTWTLSIEEQFYIAMPLIVLLLMRNARAFVWTLILITVVSLALTLFTTDQIYTKDERYFSTIYRLWQIAVGGLVFLLMHYKYVPERLRGASFIGAVFIVAPIFLFNSSYLYPSWVALFPVVGTILILMFGEEKHSLTGRAFAVKPMVYLGKISYGTYLWHWPLIVAVVYSGTRMNDEIRVMIMLASFVMGSLSYHLIETPFRKTSVKKKNKLFIYFFVQLGVLLAVAWYLWQQPGRADEGEGPRVAVLKTQVDANHDGWNDCWGHTTPETFCRMGADMNANGESPDFFLWGDSMANSAFWAFDDYGRARGEAGFLATSPGCSPIDGGGPTEECVERNAAVLDYLDQAEPMDVFLMSRWSYLALGLGHFGDVPGQVPMFLEDGSVAPDNFPAFMERLDKSLARLSARHNVYLFMTLPKFDTSVPRAMLRNVRFGAQLPVQTIAEYEAREAETNAAVTEIAQRYGVTVLKPHKILCETGTCIIEMDGLPLYMDQVHLGPRGNEFLRDYLFDQLGRRP
ncbi:MAG: acyltransferase family protein [Pseudomonadota bacterium]